MVYLIFNSKINYGFWTKILLFIIKYAIELNAGLFINILILESQITDCERMRELELVSQVFQFISRRPSRNYEPFRTFLTFFKFKLSFFYKMVKN